VLLGQASGATADRFFANFAAEFGLAQPGHRLVPYKAQADQLGMTAIRLRQFYHGLPVSGAEALVHLNQLGAVTSANGRLVSEISLLPVPVLSEAQAVAAAVQALRDEGAAQGATPEALAAFAPEVVGTELCIFDAAVFDNSAGSDPRVTWKLNIRSETPLMDVAVYTDAATGEMLFQDSHIQYALHREVWSESQLDHYSVDYDYTFGRSEGQPTRGPEPVFGERDVDQAYEHVGLTYEYFRDVFKRDGANFQGGISNNTVATVVRIEWEGSIGAYYWGKYIAVMPGGYATLDLLAHEYGHAITHYTPGLVYSGDSGSLSESFSDVMGETVEVYGTGDTNWINGHGIPRNLADPASVIFYPGYPYPDRYRLIAPGQNNNHYNSTVPSRGAYLIAIGGHFNGYDIRGLGIEKLEQIWYRAYTQYFVPGETFNDAYYDIIQAAEDLYSDADVEEVRKALQAVEMNLRRPTVYLQIPHEGTVGQVIVGQAPVTSLSVRFNQDMNVAEMLTDGSIHEAVAIVDTRTGPVMIEASQFAYDPATRLLTWTSPAPLAEGYYELQLRGDLLIDSENTQVWGGTAGLTFTPSDFATLHAVQAGSGDLTTAGFSAPTLVDWSGDGLVDLVVAEETVPGEAKIRVYHDSGQAPTANYDAFSYVQSGGGDLTISSTGGVSCRVLDWDGDGQNDLLLGFGDGRVMVSLADGLEFAAPVAVMAGPSGGELPIDVGEQAMVATADWNSDGRVDLVVGAQDGTVRVYLDTAGFGPPVLQSPLVVQNGLGNLAVPSGGAAPTVVDLDGDGRKDLVVGNSEGQLVFYRNVGTDVQPRFDGWRLVDAGGEAIGLPALSPSRPFAGDFNADGLVDLLIGTAEGRVHLATAQTPPGAVPQKESRGLKGEVYQHTPFTRPSRATLGRPSPSRRRWSPPGSLLERPKGRFRSP
jgi:bacillolysin